ncbi:MAG: DUF1513 domain-containing protein [Burkholderiales bacterium]|nr:DUF1513 domain-containing protein [Burkholderiales bacterium]
MTSALDRRSWLAGTAVLLGSWALPSLASVRPGARFAAAWEDASGYRLGVLSAQPGRLGVQASLEVPTRAHGLLAEAGGTMLSVARRPGDWLLRWGRDGQPVAWHWIEPDRAFNGHVIASADGHHLYTTESDLETGHGLIGVRDAASLEKLAEWPTQGMDPHELLLDTDGSLLVANGGIPALPETGRLKIHLDRMDASVVRLRTAGTGAEARTGELVGQWRLPDRRLSLRHMAWGHDGQGRALLGIALQAEHADAQARIAAPVLAVFDGQELRTVDAPHTLAGYGGDIAFASGCFAVSCPRANRVSLFDARAGGSTRWAADVALPEACALLVDQDGTAGASLWAGGREESVAVGGVDERTVATLPRIGSAPLRLDNHWVVLPA